MELKDLHIFLKVAEFENISRAAKELSYVQSNVTARIQRLEEELGTELFHRHNRGITLTPEGKQLLVYADKISLLMSDMKKAFQNKDMPAGKLQIGSVETVIKLPIILSAYNRKYTDVDLSLTTGVTEHLIEEVLHYRLDGAFVTAQGDKIHPELEQYEVFEENLVLITEAKEMELEEIKKRSFLVFNRGCGYRAKLEEWLRDEQASTARFMEMGTLETILGSVYSGLGVSFVPYSTVRNHLEQGLIHSHEVPKQYSRIRTVFVRKKDAFLTATVEKFIETIAECRDIRFENKLF